MKIVHAVYSLEVGGAEVLVAALCRMQRAGGHDVSICAYAQLGAIGETLRAEGFEIYVPGEANPAVTMLRYLRHFRRLRPDVVHCHNPAPTLQAAIPARLAGASSVISTRHSLVAPPYTMAEERKFSLVARCCDWIVGICESTCLNLKGAPLAQSKKIVLVYNGVSPVVRQSVRLEKSGFTFLFVGRLAAVKDLGTLLHAIALARQRNPDLKLWIVGDGELREQLRALTAELNLTDHVTFWGQRMDTAQFFSAADAFTMSSVSEGLSISLLQAMSVGLPSVITDVGGIAEVVRLSQSGLLAPVGDAAGLAEAMLRMAADRALRDEFSRRARFSYTQHFTLAEMHEAYMKLYRRKRGAHGR